jgi:hypothetical protein
VCRVIRNSKNVLASSVGNLQLAEEEMVLDVDGTIPTQPVLQHIGIGAWPGEYFRCSNYSMHILKWMSRL